MQVWVRPGANAAGSRWRYVGFEAYRVAPHARLELGPDEREACVVVLSGRVAIRWSDERGNATWELGDRATPFDGPPAAAYLSPPGRATIESVGAVDLAVGYAASVAPAASRALAPAGARLEMRGSGAMERTIHHILMEDQPASSLLVTEVVTPAGRWSSYPPHKHDTDDPPRESLLEEVYYFRFKDPRGFGLMRVYTADRSLDETIAVRDRDLVLVPRGYHTFSAAPGYDAYYLNVMAGPRREWKITFDPDHERMRW
jgi:5-deoxy-glucuronate isomerase